METGLSLNGDESQGGEESVGSSTGDVVMTTGWGALPNVVLVPSICCCKKGNPTGRGRFGVHISIPESSSLIGESTIDFLVNM